MHPVIDRFGKSVVIVDGGMGTLLQANGLMGGELPELWNLTHPEVLLKIQSDYVNAGCDILTANMVGANRVKLEKTGHTVQEVVSQALKLAHTASGGKAAVALDIGPSGKLLKPFGDLAFDDAYELFKEEIIAGRDNADLVIIETMSDAYEAKAALLAAKENCDLPVIVTFTFDSTGKLLTGSNIPAALLLAESLGADAVGINCSLGPEQMESFVDEMLTLTNLPIVINPNAGLPVSVNGETSYPVGPEEFYAYMERFAEKGAAILGGCCGTTPEHIRLLAERLKNKPVKARHIEKKTVVSSYTHTVTFGARPILIGERINPTGKPRLKQALREGDLEYLCREGIAQTEHGADILDVNVGLPELDEPAVMERAIINLQSVTNTPLQIDTSNVEAMERALRIYNGKPLVNSVNGKEESLHTVLPLVNTVLGVSNISFGLPRRELVTSTFFAMAMQRGLSSGIINPLSDELMKAYRSFCALMGIDVGCKAYIEAYANTTAAPDVRTGAAQQSAGGSAESVSLHRAIVKGLREQAGQLTDEMLKTTPPLEIINGELIPALDEVGQGFEKNTVFLPQLLMSADAAKEAFERIKQNLAKKGIQEEKKGTIILATVKGDIHDIGKNIVKVLLENYGFDVLDLGKDVPPEIIVQTAIEKNVRLVGLSALMTTTVESMAETIRQLRKAHDCKVMVGGAVLNPEYAKEIGADFYSKDAMGSVRYAEKLFNGEV